MRFIFLRQTPKRDDRFAQKYRPKPHLWLFGVILLSVLLSYSQTFAHAGGEPLLINAEAGPFFISVWGLPRPIVTGETNFVVFVAEDLSDGTQRANSPILNADITLILTPNDAASQPIIVDATHSLATNKLFYESYFDLISPGDYSGEVQVTFEGKSGTAIFPFVVTRAPLTVNWFLYSTIAAVIITAGWFLTLFAEE